MTLGLPGLAAPLRLVHLTDLHLRRPWWPGYDVVLDRLAGDPPDLICVTGDFVDDKADPSAALPTLGRFLGRLRGVARLGLFGTLGNHDCDPLRPELAGVTLLDGATARPRDDLELVGLPGVARREATRDLLALALAEAARCPDRPDAPTPTRCGPTGRSGPAWSSRATPTAGRSASPAAGR